MKKLSVHYAGWGEDWLLGMLADGGRTLLFEYSAEALSQGLELSPLHLKLSAQAYGDFPDFQFRLPGLIADSLPDGWGLMLMDRIFRRQGVRHPEPLDRLAFVGERAMGALRYAPAVEPETNNPDWTLLDLARESECVLSGDASNVLTELAVVGGSPQGARPKALVQYDSGSGAISTDPLARGAPWLVKFPAQGEHKEVCALEQLYAELARDCGLDVPETRWFDLSRKLAAFGAARFDRERGMRVPIHTLAGLLQADFRIPGSTDYTTFLRATRLMTRDEREVKKAFARAVFNVVFRNCDDHPKNFAWRLGADRRWRLAPAYDLTYSEGPRGQHHMDVCGLAAGIGKGDLLRLAKAGGVSARAANAIIEQMQEQAARLAKRAAQFPLRRATVASLVRDISAVLGRQ